MMSLVATGVCTGYYNFNLLNLERLIDKVNYPKLTCFYRTNLKVAIHFKMLGRTCFYHLQQAMHKFYLCKFFKGVVKVCSTQTQISWKGFFKKKNLLKTYTSCSLLLNCTVQARICILGTKWKCKTNLPFVFKQSII